MADPKHQNEDNWTAAGMVGMFDAVHRKRDQKRSRQVLIAWTLAITFSLGVPLWFTWVKFQDARRQTLLEEFQLRRPAADQLTQSNPAIATALENADGLKDAAMSKSVGESIADLRQAIDLLATAHELERDTKRLRQLLNPVGQTLLETPWHVNSEKITSEQRRLSAEHKRIVALLDQGNLSEAETAMADLLHETSRLQRGNVEAMQSSVARQSWARLEELVPKRLSEDPAWRAISDVGHDAEEGWNAGEWLQARTLFARAVERAEEFLESQLEPDEKAQILQSDAEVIKLLHSERDSLAEQVRSLEKQIAEHNQQLAALIADRQTALGKLDIVTAERDQLQTKNAKLTTEVETLRPLQQQLDTAVAKQEAAEKQANELMEANESIALDLAEVRNQLREASTAYTELLIKRFKSYKDTDAYVEAVTSPSAGEMEFVFIRPGKFKMGSDSKGAGTDEKPVHEVDITKSYYVGKYEVTIRQILEWLNSPNIVFDDTWIDLAHEDCPIAKSASGFVINAKSEFARSEDQPMVCISWHGAKAFCEWCSVQDSRYSYRVPTEAEWEYMARAKSESETPWGGEKPDGRDPFGFLHDRNTLTTTNANFHGGPGKTAIVGSYQPNFWGVYDTVGNVGEWCEDVYEEDFYQTPVASRPDPVNRSSSTSIRVVRSGSWNDDSIRVRSASRFHFVPEHCSPELGFRVVAEWTAPEASPEGSE
ncbi:MAG: SUMF1/EgtB/PvdO family nonheme iron enzyme [Planctomycetaceae bacterium]|nr:SUMF1/EgtB/PvdO family nonheme iron enzyme [Planctomycetaceae bacterium]MCB9952155.1 SUMF1/EgtB/PvdO family nonheme iron enzyme [Planctomycetaceae bacterium]